MTKFDDDEIKRLRALCEAATPGPWLPWNSDEHNEAEVKHRGGHGLLSICDVKSWDRRAENSRLIAAARTALPKCLNEIERLTHDLHSAEDARDIAMNSAEHRGKQRDEARCIARKLYQMSMHSSVLSVLEATPDWLVKP